MIHLQVIKRLGSEAHYTLRIRIGVEYRNESGDEEFMIEAKHSEGMGECFNHLQRDILVRLFIVTTHLCLYSSYSFSNTFPV